MRTLCLAIFLRRKYEFAQKWAGLAIPLVACAMALTASAATAVVDQPRGTGYFVGDKCTQRVLLNALDSLSRLFHSLCRVASAWFERRTASIQTDPSSHRWLVIEYQILSFCEAGDRQVARLVTVDQGRRLLATRRRKAPNYAWCASGARRPGDISQHRTLESRDRQRKWVPRTFDPIGWRQRLRRRPYGARLRSQPEPFA